jgi:hypothetical protein
VLLPESVRYNMPYSPVTEEEVHVAAQALAEACLQGTVETSAALKLTAAQYLFESLTVVHHPDPESLLTHLSPEDAAATVLVLRRNGLMH